MNNKPRFSLTRAATLAAMAAATLVLVGCASPSHSIDTEAQARAASVWQQAPEAQDFPAIESAQWKQGSFPSVGALREMRTGMGKDQVRTLLSWPHFSEGLGGVREWNYIFHFRTGAGPEYLTCQYMVRFNNDVLASGMYWNKPECAALVDPSSSASAQLSQAVPAVTAAPPRKVVLRSDGLFRFDGSGLGDLQMEGRAKVEALAASLRANLGAINAIRVTGHTDRLGTEAYNQTLSLARANTVRDLLVQHGVPSDLIQTVGMGERQPAAVNCNATVHSPTLVACLQPNRRVDVEVNSRP